MAGIAALASTPVVAQRTKRPSPASQVDAVHQNDRLIRSHGLIAGCPPSRTHDQNCLPATGGPARRLDRADWWKLPGVESGPFRYRDGYLVRFADGGRVAAYYPLLGGALSVGNIWPDWYVGEPLPPYLEDYYSLGVSYRYADNVLYRTDLDSATITSIAALLTGSRFRVGQRMPAGFDAYNVPFGFRDRYRDGPDAHYRYGDGHIYEIDPGTGTIRSAIELLR